MSKIKVTVWSEGLPEREVHAVKSYPNDINNAIAAFLRNDPDLEITVRDISMDECGLSQEIIDNTDVLVYWSHLYNNKVPDEVANRIVSAVLQRGMGFMPLHSGLFCKAGSMLLGKCGAGGKYRECGERARVWVINRAHPITAGLEDDWFDIEYDEMYGEPFGVPTPDELIFITWFQGGEVLRSGMTWNRGAGKVFYFQPGHEEWPIYTENKYVQKVITNAVKWLKPAGGPPPVGRGEVDALEPLPDAPFQERLARTKGKINKRPEPGQYKI